MVPVNTSPSQLRRVPAEVPILAPSILRTDRFAAVLDLLVRGTRYLAGLPCSVTHGIRGMTLRHSGDSRSAGGTRVLMAITRRRGVVGFALLDDLSYR